MFRPRVWLIPYDRNWSYDFNAKAIAAVLGKRFDFRIAYEGTPASVLRDWRPHLAVDFWWAGHARRLLPSVPVLKQVSSHRWGQKRYGSMGAHLFVRRHMATANGVIVPSARLRDELDAAGARGVRLTRKGFDPSL